MTQTIATQWDIADIYDVILDWQGRVDEFERRDPDDPATDQYKYIIGTLNGVTLEARHGTDGTHLTLSDGDEASETEVISILTDALGPASSARTYDGKAWK
ncbi:hypothetical protein [Lacticaseibacillus yichunensis]|uniref:Uncharacterized protein n=1 Tax=Lacticaseibacillus yichunensis TaxID=2486015 RepID=A0ABW4CNK7_9LACO|nr:hypothetical protein [Lacticaseibacillus yichunensis]